MLEVARSRQSQEDAPLSSSSSSSSSLAAAAAGEYQGSTRSPTPPQEEMDPRRRAELSRQFLLTILRNVLEIVDDDMEEF